MATDATTIPRDSESRRLSWADAMAANAEVPRARSVEHRGRAKRARASAALPLGSSVLQSFETEDSILGIKTQDKTQDSMFQTRTQDKTQD